MIHSCKVHCHTFDPDREESMGMEDPGKWLPFSFHMSIVQACKMTSDDEDDRLYDCTTIFTDNNDTFIIDTSFKEFDTLFKLFNPTPIDLSSLLPKKDDKEPDL